MEDKLVNRDDSNMGCDEGFDFHMDFYCMAGTFFHHIDSRNSILEVVSNFIEVEIQISIYQDLVDSPNNYIEERGSNIDVLSYCSN